VRAALIEVGVRRLATLVDAVMAVIEQRQGNAIDAVLALGDLGATAELDRAAQLLGKRYAGWIEGARATASRR
jgi:hypothetical protein